MSETRKIANHDFNPNDFGECVKCGLRDHKHASLAPLPVVGEGDEWSEWWEKKNHVFADACRRGNAEALARRNSSRDAWNAARAESALKAGDTGFEGWWNANYSPIASDGYNPAYDNARRAWDVAYDLGMKAVAPSGGINLGSPQIPI